MSNVLVNWKIDESRYKESQDVFLNYLDNMFCDDSYTIIFLTWKILKLVCKIHINGPNVNSFSTLFNLRSTFFIICFFDFDNNDYLN